MYVDCQKENNRKYTHSARYNFIQCRAVVLFIISFQVQIGGSREVRGTLVLSLNLRKKTMVGVRI